MKTVSGKLFLFRSNSKKSRSESEKTELSLKSSLASELFKAPVVVNDMFKMDRPEDRQLMLIRDYQSVWFPFLDSVLVRVWEISQSE